MTSWKPHRLDQLGTVARGKSRHRPRNDPVLYGGQWPFFQTGDVKAAELYLREFTQTYSDTGLAQSKLWPTGTLCITIAANIADTAILAIPGCFPDSVVGFIADPQKAEARFIKYCIDTLKQGMQNASHGTTQDNLSVDKLLTFDFVVPPVDEQRRIASILSAYDDLIENNTRRIAILDEMARRLYEEWFVRFRFPGHEGVRMVESELGLVPEGWDVVRLDQVLVLQRGFDLPKQDRAEGSFPIVSATGVSGSHSDCKVTGPGVVTGRSGSLGTVMYIEGDFWPLNTTLWVKQFLVGSPLYAFFVLQGIDLAGFNSGAAVPTLNRNDIHGLPVVRPPAEVLRQFDNVAHPIVTLKNRLLTANTNLRTTRDLLLPKLISGELDVSKLPAPEAVASA